MTPIEIAESPRKLHQAIIASVIDLEDPSGHVASEDLVKAAADPDHPAHSEFEWDDTEAGRLYRLEQAAAIIRRVKIEVEVNEIKVKAVRYVSIPDDDKRGFVAVPKMRLSAVKLLMLDELRRIAGNVERTIAVARIRPCTVTAGVVKALVPMLKELAGAIKKLK